jgi:hypothetical protein
MVENYKKEHFLSTLDFVKNNLNQDFYITKDNHRTNINNSVSLKFLLKECVDNKIVIEKGDILGIVSLWKSLGNSVGRCYIKLNAINEEIADKLLTVTLWNTKQELWVKIKNNSKFLNVFKNKGFIFAGVRGVGDKGDEILLVKRFIEYIKRDKPNVINQPKIENKIPIGG